MYYLVTQRPGGPRQFVNHRSGLPTQFPTVKSAREAGYPAGTLAWAVKEAGGPAHEIIGKARE
jgi:hypothetical protein